MSAIDIANGVLAEQLLPRSARRVGVEPQANRAVIQQIIRVVSYLNIVAGAVQVDCRVATAGNAAGLSQRAANIGRIVVG